jgi:7-cyano-7-deazaguanine synthase
LAEQIGGNRLVQLIRNSTHTFYLGIHDVLHEWGYGCGHVLPVNCVEAVWEKYAAAWN